jgi:hypothetical protein
MPRSGLVAPFWIELPRAEYVLQMLPAMVDELGVHDDLVDLALGAVATHVGLLEHLIKGGVRVYAVDDVAEDFLLALGAKTVARAEHQLFPIGSLFGHLNYLLLRRLRG